MMIFDAYLFDMDGLLLDTERAFLNAALTLLEPRGHDPARIEALFRSLVGSDVATTRAALQGELGGAAAVFEEEWYALHGANMARHVPVKDTVRETLDTLSGQGAQMAVVTSTRGHLARAKLKTAGLDHHFAFVIAGDEVPANKPDPAPYLMAAEAFGAPPQACAAFEDSDRGIASAMAAGCRGVQIPDLRPEDVPLPQLGQLVAETLAQGVAAAQAAGRDGPRSLTNSVA
ncbi:MAG: HAD family phosphatase [Pseudomonadota bacterium]